MFKVPSNCCAWDIISRIFNYLEKIGRNGILMVVPRKVTIIYINHYKVLSQPNIDNNIDVKVIELMKILFDVAAVYNRSE